VTAYQLLNARKSTIGRSIQSFGLGTTRAAFRLADSASPALGARWAERFWFTVPRGRRRRAAEAETGTPLEVPVHGSRIVGETWGSGPAVYLLHGWGGHRGQLGALAGPLAAAGYQVTAIDAPSHGDSPPGPSGPRQATLLEFADALTAAVAAGGPAHGVVAHSTGAMATALAMRAGLEVPRLTFVAPLADMAPFVPMFAEHLGLGDRTLARLVKRVEQRVGLPFSAFDIPALAPEVAGSSSLLLVHDRDDPLNPWSGSKAIAAAWPCAKLMSTTGLRHNRILRDPDVVAEVTAFMQAP
jgi:pimeloyl-ACP methyl ester carboxylesterase